MVSFSPESSPTKRLKMWHLLPIAAGLHGLLFLLPVQTASSVSEEKPKDIPLMVNVSSLPKPIAPPSQIRPNLPLAKPPAPKPPTQAIVPTPVQQVVQPVEQQQRPAMEQPVQRVVESRVTEKVIANEKRVQQDPAPTKPETAEPVKPVDPKPVEPKPELNTTADILTNTLGGQVCGDGCIQTAAVSRDVLEQLTKTFGNRPEEIRDLNNDGYFLGYSVINRKGEREFLYASLKSVTIDGKPAMVSQYYKLPELITSREALAQRGITS